MAVRERYLVGVALETTPGVAAAVGGSDVLALQSFSLSPGLEYLDTGKVQPSLTARPRVVGRKSASASLEYVLKYAATPGTTPPRIGRVLRMAGFSETLDGTADTATYAPASGTLVTGTVQAWTDDRDFLLKGCAASFRISGQAGGLVVLSADLQGVYAGNSASAFPSPTFDGDGDIVLSNATLTGLPGQLQAFELNVNNSIALVPAPGQAEGVAYAEITNREVTGSLTVLTHDVNILNAYEGAGTLNVVISITDGASTFEVSVPQMQIAGVDPLAEVDGLLAMQVDFVAVNTAEDAEVTLTWK